MDIAAPPPATDQRAASARVARRLRPLYAGAALQSLMLWIPVEKLFLSDVGFTPATIGLMAAVYAGVVPLAEVPSGILADRWSRRGVMALAGTALALCSLVGALTHDVGTYLVAMGFLGVYFAMHSGSVESMVYDTVVEETGDGTGFTRWMGRLRAMEAAGLAVSALLGGLVGEVLGARSTFWLTVPIAVVSVLVLLRFREPGLHRPDERVPLRDQVRLTARTIADRGVVLPVVALGAAAGLLLQLVFEFGPLWLVALAAPTLLFGPHWAALTATLGIGGLLADRVPWQRRGSVLLLGAAMTAAAAVTASSGHVLVVTVAQSTLALALVVVAARASQRLNDAIPSSVRAGVVSGAGTLTWLTFLPAALATGWLTEAYGVAAAGWLFTGLAVLTALLAREPGARPGARGRRPPRARRGRLACREVAQLAPAYVDGELPEAARRAVDRHWRRCPGCQHHLEQVRDVGRVLAMIA